MAVSAVYNSVMQPSGTRPDLTISAIIPLYNGERFIRQALASIACQTRPPHEIIVVDDGSTDGGVAAVEAFASTVPVTILRKANGGQSSARNFGVERATGELIALLDQDDIWYPQHLERLAAPFAVRQPIPLAWTYSDLDEIDEAGNLVSRGVLHKTASSHPKRDLLDCLRQDLFILPSASVISREAFIAAGGFDEQLSGYEDDDLFVRLFSAGYQNIYVDRPLSKWRIYAASTSFSPRMSKSRMLFAQKLVDAYPDDKLRAIYYARDLIVPRFLHQVVETMRRALRVGQFDAADSCKSDIATLESLVDPAQQQGLFRTNLITTVVIPLFNGARYIETALKSVLEQTLAADEIIVVDDGSTDDGAAIVRRIARDRPIILLSQANLGPAAARNLGVSHAHGDLVAFLDHDDVWLPTHLAELIGPFQERRPGVLGWSYSNIDEIGPDGGMVTRSLLTAMGGAHPKSSLSDCLRHDMMVPVSASLVSRKAFEAIGGFDVTLKGYEDDDLFIRLYQAGFASAYIDKPLTCWRAYPDSTSFTPAMARSRMTYVRKLVRSFAPDDTRQLFYIRDLIVPRFMHHATETLRRALRSGNLTFAESCVDHIHYLEGLADDPDRRFLVRPAPLITVVIPLFNGASFIEEALRSVLSQSLAPDEIIVVDDGSTDNGPAIVAELAAVHPIRLLTKANGGQSSARNHGIVHAHGDLIALLDQDDAWYPSHLAELTRPFREVRSRPLGWTYSNLDEIDVNGDLIAQAVLNRSGHPKTNIIDCLRQDMFVLPSASVISRRAFEAVGGFDSRLAGYEDDDLFIRMLQAGYDNVFIDTALSRWRVYPGSTSFSPRMAVSRMTFANKLIDAFPNEPDKSLYYARDLIVPRFLHHVAETLRRSLRAGDSALADACVRDLAILDDAVPLEGRRRQLRSNLLITAVIPLHNGARTIEEALRSALQQTLPPDEIIVVDDGSTDGGPDIVRRMSEHCPVRLLHKPQGTPASARNLGIRHAHGDLIAILDQDDIWYPSHLAELIVPFRQDQPRPIGWSYGNVDQADESGEVLAHSVLTRLPGEHPKAGIADCLRQDMFVLLSASLISRRALLDSGGFDEHLSCYDDEDLFIRLLHAGYANVFLDRPLSRCRSTRRSGTNARRMAASRMDYARKLIALFPDNPDSDHYLVRDLIAPRFAGIAIEEARRALTGDDDAWIDTCVGNLHFFDGLLKADEGTGVSHRAPLISTIIPLYNGAPFIREAIQSVLDQTLKPDEIIVVDDGSTDDGPEIVASMAKLHPIRLIRQENAGQSAARNIGVDHSHGDLLSFLDQDDIWYPNHLSELVAPFRQPRPCELGWAYSDLAEIDQQGRMVCRAIFAHFRFSHPKRDLMSCLREDMFILPSAAVISRRAFEAVGGFDERLSGYEDDDLFMRMFRAGFDNAFLPEPLSKWRIFRHSSSFSPRMAVSRAAYARMLIEQFPDDEEKMLYYVRDVIAPRFFLTMAADFRRAVLKDDRGHQRLMLGHLTFIAGYLRPPLRVSFRYCVLPLLHLRPVARLFIPHQLKLSRLLRRIL